MTTGSAAPGAVARETGARLAAAERAGLNATLHWSQALLDAEAARAEALPGTSPSAAPPLAGVPVALKDNIVTVEQPTTCGSRMLEGYLSPYNATVVDRLRHAGALVAAKTNMDEFAMGSSTEHSAFGRVRNPLSTDRVSGGSSGGSAALVAAGAVPVALGSETGGSVRQPASFCGVVGLKPSYGRVSRFGLVAFGSSLDCVSVFGRTVEEAARVLEVIAGPDANDSTTLDLPPPSFAGKSRSDLRGLTVGLPREYFPGDLDPGVAAALRRTVAAAQDFGAEVREVDLPHTRYAVPTYYIVAPAEAAANLARYDGVRYGRRALERFGEVGALYRATRGEGFGAEVRRRILIGTYVLSAGYYDAYYRRAQQVRALITGDFSRVFDAGVDLLLTPTTPTPAFRAGEKVADPLTMYLADIFTVAVSLAGLPAVSIPVGRDGGLPIGAQLIAPARGEELLVGAAAALESAVPAAEEVR